MTYVQRYSFLGLGTNERGWPSSQFDQWLAALPGLESWDALASSLQYFAGMTWETDEEARREWSRMSEAARRNYLQSYFYEYAAEPYQVGGKVPEGATGITYGGSGPGVTFPGATPGAPPVFVPINPTTGALPSAPSSSSPSSPSGSSGGAAPDPYWPPPASDDDDPLETTTRVDRIITEYFTPTSPAASSSAFPWGPALLLGGLGFFVLPAIARRKDQRR